MNRSLSQRIAWSSLILLVVLTAATWLSTWQAVRRAQMGKALIAAIKEDDAKTAVMLLEQGADPNIRDGPQVAFSLRRRLLDLLLLRSQQPSTEPTPLLLTVNWNSRFVRSNRVTRRQVNMSDIYLLVKALLEHGADVNARDPAGCVSLQYALTQRDVKMARLLLEYGASAKSGGQSINRSSLEPPLVAAVRQSLDPDLIQEMIDHGADINAQDRNGYTALHWAALWNREDVVRMLLDHHVDVTLKNGNGKTVFDLLLAPETAPPTSNIIRLLKQTGAK